MNETLRSPLSLLLALLLALVAACSPAGDQPPPLQGATMGGPFALTDQNGKTVRDTDFAGRYRLIYFGYTFCPDVCPVDLQSIGQALRAFEKAHPALAARVQPIFITVDPERDTPAVLKPYVAAFHPRLIGLTGTPKADRRGRQALRNRLCQAWPRRRAQTIWSIIRAWRCCSGRRASRSRSCRTIRAPTRSPRSSNAG